MLITLILDTYLFFKRGKRKNGLYFIDSEHKSLFLKNIFS